VLSANVNRRHMAEGQRALSARPSRASFGVLGAARASSVFENRGLSQPPPSKDELIQLFANMDACEERIKKFGR
jgi:hypothetical protein